MSRVIGIIESNETPDHRISATKMFPNTTEEKLSHGKRLIETYSLERVTVGMASSILLNHRIIDLLTAEHLLPLVPKQVFEDLLDFAAFTPQTDEGWSRYTISHAGSLPSIPKEPPRQSSVRHWQWEEVQAYRQAAEAIRAYCDKQGKPLKAPEQCGIELTLEEVLNPDLAYDHWQEIRATIAESFLGWKRQTDANGRVTWQDPATDRKYEKHELVLDTFNRLSELWDLLLQTHPWKYEENPKERPRWADLSLRQHLDEPYPFEPSLVYRPTPCVTVIRKKSADFPWHTELDTHGEPTFSYMKLVEAIKTGENFSIPGTHPSDAVCRALLVARIQQQQQTS